MKVVIGRYVPGSGFFYDMDPRTKIIALALLMIATFLIDSFYLMLMAIGLIVILMIAGRIGIKRVYMGLRPLMFLLIFTFVFQVLFNRQGEVLLERAVYYSPLSFALAIGLVVFWIFTKKFTRFKLLYFLAVVAGLYYIFTELGNISPFGTGTLAVYEEGLTMAAFIMLRLIIIVTLSTILTITTKPTDLNLGLEHVLKPLKLFRINTEDIAMIISISLRYIPTLLDEANKIMLAQASRGVDFKEGKLKDKVMQIVSLLVPMFIISFKRSDELANAMEARSFQPGAMRTRLHVLSWKTLDTVTIVIAFVALTLSIALRIWPWI
ncbi:MAG: energy-coupling factor transporter transmembrane component T family protein [Bacillota bacterium]